MAKEKRSLCFSNRPAHKEGGGERVAGEEGSGGERVERGGEENGGKMKGREVKERARGWET